MAAAGFTWAYHWGNTMTCRLYSRTAYLSTSPLLLAQLQVVTTIVASTTDGSHLLTKRIARRTRAIHLSRLSATEAARICLHMAINIDSKEEMYNGRIRVLVQGSRLFLFAYIQRPCETREQKHAVLQYV
jgi:hypothetical protein